MFGKIEAKLKFEFKRNVSNSWELKARSEIRECCRTCQSLDTFVTAFAYSLAEYRQDSVGLIKDAYKAVKIDKNTVHVYWVNHVKVDGKDKLVAVITTIENAT